MLANIKALCLFCFANLHEIALANGGTDEGAPGPRGEADENGLVFYASYFRDRDGNKLNAFCMAKADG